jgi:hypothetical protein
VTWELSIQDVASIIERVPDLSGMMLVGGKPHIASFDDSRWT